MRWLFLVASIVVAALAALALIVPLVGGDEPEWRRLSVVCIAFMVSYTLLRKAFPPKGALVITGASETPGIDDNLRLFVGRNREYYFTKWSGMMRRHSAFSWNWAALLFGPFWLVYRKMYLVGSAAVIVIVATDFVDSATANGMTSYTFLDGVVLALWGFSRPIGKLYIQDPCGQENSACTQLGSASYLHFLSHSITYDIDRTKRTINGIPADGAAHPTKYRESHIVRWLLRKSATKSMSSRWTFRLMSLAGM
jgi:hypothetical protein